MITSPSPCFVQASWLNIGLLCAHYFIPLLFPVTQQVFGGLSHFSETGPLFFSCIRIIFRENHPKHAQTGCFPGWFEDRFPQVPHYG